MGNIIILGNGGHQMCQRKAPGLTKKNGHGCKRQSI